MSITLDPLEEIPVLPENPVLPHEPLTRREILLRAAVVLEEHGWCRSLRYAQTGAHCIVGAIAVAGGYNGDGEGEYNFAHEVIGSVGVSHWNDEQTSIEPVTAALRRMADGATWREATGG